MAKNKETRALEDAERAERLAALISGGTLTKGQRHILGDILLNLSNDTGVYVNSPEVVAAFYLAAARCKGSARHRNELVEALRLIESGEAFDDYIDDDGVRFWEIRRRARKHSAATSVGGELCRALADEKTPDDYRTALTKALREFAGIADTGFDEARPYETFLDAEAELAIWPKRPGLSDARLHICDLLEGLKKKWPIDRITPRAREQGAPESAKPAPVKELTLNESWGREAAEFGFLGGDRLELETADAPRPGEVLAVADESGVAFGRFVRFENSFHGRVIVLDTADNEDSYRVTGSSVLRPLRVTRRYEAPATTPAGGGDDLSPEARQRIETLRRQLDRLYEPENEAARFRIEREIYDLTRAPACADDEWPEVVAG